MTAKITGPRATALSIGELSRQTAVNIETIRYYEKIELVSAPPRTNGGRRVYGYDHVRIFSFIRRARELGFTQDEVRALIKLNSFEFAPCNEVQEIAKKHLDSVRSKLSDLARLERVLAETLTECAASNEARCPVLDMLGDNIPA